MTPGSASHLIVSLRSVAIGSALVALTSLTVLIVVTAIEDESALNTVAIALAILAFVVQIIVYIAQAAATNAAMAQSQNLYGETLRVLTQIRERTEGTQAVVTKQFDKVLEHALSLKIPEGATGKELKSPEFIREVADSVSDLLDQASDSGARADAPSSYPPLPSPAENAPVLDYMRKWPSRQEFDELAQALAELPDDAKQRLANLATDEVHQRSFGHRYGPGLYVDPQTTEPLIRAGLVKFLDGYVDEDGWPLSVLTERGRNVGRLVTAAGDPPDYAATWSKTLRQTLE